MRTRMLGTEPVAIISAARMIILAAMTFGLMLSEAQFVAIMGAVEAVLAIFTRTQVSPLPKKK